MSLLKSSLILALSLFTINSINANEAEDYKVKITKDIPYVDVDVMGEAVRIKRIQDTNHKLRNS